MQLVRWRIVPIRMVGRALTAVAAVGLLAPPASASPSETPQVLSALTAVTSGDACLDSEEVAFLANINEHRQSSGLAPLAVSASLSSAAAYHSIDMALNGYLDHNLLDGTSVPQNMANFGYTGGTYGENIAAGMESADVAMQTWQNSYEHNANMLSGRFGAIGIGRAYNDASAHGWYWTTIFGDVSDGPGWLCGETPPPSKSASLFQSVDGATTEGDVNLRTGPGGDYAVVATLPASTPMTITGAEQQSYVPVKADGMYGWVASDWIQRGSITLEQTADPSQAGTATAIEEMQLLSLPNEQGVVIGSIPSVSVVTLTGEAQDGYLGVSFNGQDGWADAAYLQVADNALGVASLQASAPADRDQALTAAPGATNGTSPSIGGQAITTTDVNLRSQPSLDSMVVRIVPAGTEVSLTGSQVNGYVNVRAGQQAGWIDSAYLQ